MGHKKNKNAYQPKKTSSYEQRQPSDPPEVIIAEGLRLQQLMAKSKENLSLVDDFCYLLSKKWFNSWKDYTGYEDLIKGQDPQKSKYFGKRKPGRINTDITGKNDKIYKIPEQLPEYSYLDVVLDEDMVKEKDFIVVDSQVFTFFYQKYEGSILKRPIRKLKSGPYFDTHLHSFTVCFLTPNQVDKIVDAEQDQIQKNFDDYVELRRMQVSSIWDMGKLKDFLAKYLDVNFNIPRQSNQLTIWKWENFLSFKQIKMDLIDGIRSAEYKLTARKLNNEEENEWDLDDFLKDSCVIFVESNNIDFKRGELPQEITGYCEQCIKVNKLIETCPCKKVFYCSVGCRYDDKAYHFKTCGVAYESSDDEEYLEKIVDTKAVTTKCGLKNLGNTCYMNSTLQCLCNINSIAQYFCSNKYLQFINKEEQSENKSIFIKKFAKFMKKMFENEEYQPWSLKMQISYFIGIFKGYQQHDANDLFVYLLSTLNDFSSKSQHSNFAIFIEQSFLGEFNSLVKCPECTSASHTKDLFLQVSVPLKAKAPLKQLSYCIVRSWKNSVKGLCQAEETWEEVFHSIGLKYQEWKVLVGPDRAQLRQVTQLPPEVWKKHKKDVVYFYPRSFPITQNTTYEIPIILAFTKLISGMEAKCYYGNPVFIYVSSSFKLSAVFQQIATVFEVDLQNLQLIDSFIIKSEEQYQELKDKMEKQEVEKMESDQLKEIQNKDVKRTKEEEKKYKAEQDKIKEAERKAKENQLRQFENKINNEFLENIYPILKFKIYIKSCRKSKRACVFCHKKCNGCLLPFSVTQTVDEFIKLTEDEFKLQIVFDQNQQLIEQTQTSNYNPYTTLQQCLVEFSQPQQLDEENAWYCQVCDHMRLAFKQLKIDKYPKVLVIQLKRFKEHQGKKVKNNEVVLYPEILETDTDIKYQLNSVIVHEGSMEAGHYWAICRKNGKYYCLNDEKISEEKDHFSKHAYILFYEIL